MNINKVVYTHRRLDTNKVFYVGMGTLQRPTSKQGRSNHWHSIVNKAGYEIKVVAKDLSKSDALELEAFMIEEYGLENLCNFTTGGECTTHSQETKDKLSKHFKGRKQNPEDVERRIASIDYSKRKVTKNTWSGKIVVDESTDIEYESLVQACKELGFSYSAVSKQMSGYNNRQDYNNLIYK